jgi:hypothetical protein
MELVLIVAVLALFGMVVDRWGVDSRITNLDPNTASTSTGIL